MDIDEVDTFLIRSPFPQRNGKSLQIQRLVDCQHFHYPSVELGPIKVTLLSVIVDENEDDLKTRISIESNSNYWVVERSRENWAMFDRQLHRCVFERQYSKLEELFTYSNCRFSEYEEILEKYTERLSELTGSIITCYPVLKFLEIDCRGGHFEPAEEKSINVPAIAAAVVTKAFEPTDCSHLRLKVGDILSITEMSNKTQAENPFWKAKLTISNQKFIDPRNSRLGFEIGYFPRDCVMLIDDKRLPNPLNQDKKQSPRNAKKYMTTVFRYRKRDPVFGLELTEIYARNGHKVPNIVEKCCAAIEDQGIVTGIYRQCGIQSNIQRLRAKFDSGAEPDLHEFGQRDIYSVSSLLKQYFRQLPIPLFTYQLYAILLDAYEMDEEDSKKIENLRTVLERFPEAHYKTAKFLMEHLSRLCKSKALTDMTSKNLAIVWSPNLFRPPPTLCGVDAHMLSGLNVHTAICDYFIEHAEKLFFKNEEDDLEVSKTSNSLESSFTMIPKSATMSDMRSENDSRWPRFLRGKSVEGFWKFNKKQTSNVELCELPTTEVRWRRSSRSHSTDASFQSSRTDSFIQFMHSGMDQLREGMRIFRARARSMRPTSRQPGSPRSRRARFSHAGAVSTNFDETVQSSSTSSRNNLSQQNNSNSSRNLYSSIITRTVSVSGDSDEQTFDEPGLREKKVMFKTATEEQAAPIHERSSPVEEWSSDSRESLHLEMSRYDNVSPSGTITRNNREKTRNLPSSNFGFETARGNHLFLT